MIETCMKFMGNHFFLKIKILFSKIDIEKSFVHYTVFAFLLFTKGITKMR